MSTVLMFVTNWCPYCRKAFSIMEELKRENPKYSEIDLKVIDEDREPEIAEKYDYYLVPTYYVNGEKLHEGVPSKAIIKAVFDKALE